MVLRRIRTQRYLDPNRGVKRRRVVVLFEALTYLAGADAHDWVISCRVVHDALVDLYADRSLFQLLRLTVDAMQDYVSKKQPTPIACSEWLAFQNLFQLRQDHVAFFAFSDEPSHLAFLGLVKT